MKKIIYIALMCCAAAAEVAACTSAIVSGTLTANGRPLLWKHRDASDLDNKVEKIVPEDGGYGYVALFNATDTLCRQAWAGYNATGFAVMNTASYNLKADTVTDMDKEGLLMGKALASCATVDDFERLLQSLPKPLGVEANFGVIDARGGAAYFETCNYSYRRFDVAGYMVRTNYSKSGREDEGYGYIREKNAEKLLAPFIKERNVTPAVFTETLSRSFYHSLIGKDFATDTVEWVVDRDFIPRYSSSASVVIEGVNPGDNPMATTMWTVLGYPPCGVVEPAWIFEGGVPECLRADSVTWKAPACEKSKALKKKVFPMRRDNGQNYLNIGELKSINEQNREQSIENYKKGYVTIEKLLKK